MLPSDANSLIERLAGLVLLDLFSNQVIKSLRTFCNKRYKWLRMNRSTFKYIVVTKREMMKAVTERVNKQMYINANIYVGTIIAWLLDWIVC